jgi:hypothetical protein
MRFLAAAGLVTILSGLGAYYATDELSLFSIANLVVGPLLLLIAGVIEARRFQGFTGALSRRVALRWGLISAAVLAVGLAATLVSRRWDATLDLTAERRYTLSDQSREVCKQIGTNRSADRNRAPPQLLLLKDTLVAKEVRLLIKAYQRTCPELEVREIRTADAPPEAQAILDAVEVTVLACQGGRCEPAGFPSEENITNAVLRLSRRREIQIHFLVGHGEANFASQGEHGFAGLAGALREEGLHLEALVGPAMEEIPASASVLFIAGAERNLLPAELEALERYLERGGRLLALLEPGVSTNLEPLLGRWGFELPSGVMADRASSPLLEDPKPVSLLLRAYNPFHPVTRKLSNRTMLLLPSARPILPVRKPQAGDALEALVFSNRSAWLETDVVAALADRPITPDPEEQIGQELPLAAAGRYPRDDGEARIVIIGDRDFASNRLLSALYNRDLLLNAVLWLAADEEHISIRPKAWTPDQDPITFQQTLAYFYFLAFALPEILLLLGIHAWYRQRGG